MFQSLAVAVVSLSLAKPLIGTALLIAWGRWATIVDKDAAYWNQSRRMWNIVQAAAGVLGFAVLLLVPWFFVGLVLGLGIMGGAALGYVSVRNKGVPESERWTLSTNAFQKMLAAKREERAVRAATLRFPGARGLKPVPLSDDLQFEPHMLLDEVFNAALTRHANRIDIAGNESQFAAVLNIDGIDTRLGQWPTAQALPAMDYLKQHCGLDVADRRRKQTGKCTIEVEGQGTHEVRVHTAGSTRGITFAILIDPVKQVTIPLGELGLLDSQMERLKGVLAMPRGAVLVASSAKQGRTTTLYALAAAHDPYTMDIQTVEPEIERELEGTNQQAVAAADTAKAVHTLLLKDPHVVVVSQVTEPQTARLLGGAAAEGRRVYAGLRADDTFSALKMWVKAVGDVEVASRGLTAVIAQRLMRRLCPVCRQKYKPDAAVLRKLNLPADRIGGLYKAGGKVLAGKDLEPCGACGGTGYRGRIGVFEVMVLDDEARSLLRAGNLDALRTHLRRGRMLWLDEAALARVVDGTTSLSEMARALGQEKQAPPPAAAPPSAPAVPEA